MGTATSNNSVMQPRKGISVHLDPEMMKSNRCRPICVPQELSGKRPATPSNRKVNASTRLLAATPYSFTAVRGQIGLDQEPVAGRCARLAQPHVGDVRVAQDQSEVQVRLAVHAV
jgi:hypothetical protein